MFARNTLILRLICRMAILPMNLGERQHPCGRFAWLLGADMAVAKHGNIQEHYRTYSNIILYTMRVAGSDVAWPALQHCRASALSEAPPSLVNNFGKRISYYARQPSNELPRVTFARDANPAGVAASV